MKTEEEMRALFPYCPEACDNTVEIAEKCNVELDWDSIILPNYPLLDPGETHESQFRRECEEGLAKRYGDDWDGKEIGGVDIRERFEFEYKVICEKGFAAYFLIVAEYVRWAKQNGIGDVYKRQLLDRVERTIARKLDSLEAGDVAAAEKPGARCAFNHDLGFERRDA